jgi:uncharacterized protein YbjT (DUF2867 family)
LRVAVAGATGFTGRRVIGELQRRGCSVVALARPRLQWPSSLDGVEVVPGDMADAAALALLLRGCDAYVHVASLGFGHAGAVTKAVDDSKVRRLGSAWTLLRPTMIYGAAGDRNMERLIRFMARSPLVPLPGGGKGLVQPVHVEDLGRAAVDALFCDKTHGRAYDLSGGEASPLRDLVRHVHGLLGRRHLVLPLPIAPMAFAAGAWSVLRLPPHVKPEQIQRLAEDKAFSFEAARADWGYAPRSWREGLTGEVAALRASGLIR